MDLGETTGLHCDVSHILPYELTHHAHTRVCLHLLVHCFPQSLPHEFLLRCCMRLGYTDSCIANALQNSVILMSIL